VGAIVAVNIVIYSGIDGGYEATPIEVFEEKPAVGLASIFVVVICAISGAGVAARGDD